MKPSDLVPVTVMNVKSLITWPRRDSRVASGRVEIRGVAWTGRGRVTKVEFATGEGGAWEAAELKGPGREGSWRQWLATCDLRPGRHVVRVRATDSNGETQPESTPWNKSGYLWNAIDRVSFEVG